MPLTYEKSQSGALMQGEILSPVWEHRSSFPAIQLPSGVDIDFEHIEYPRLIVMTANCDLLWDYDARKESGGENLKTMPHILLCRLYEEAEIRDRPQINSRIRGLIKSNQHERYHHLDVANIGNPAEGKLPDLYLDFKRSLSLPTRNVYLGLENPDTSSRINRVAVVPPIYIHDLIHRFYGFLSRIGTPD